MTYIITRLYDNHRCEHKENDQLSVTSDRCVPIGQDIKMNTNPSYSTVDKDTIKMDTNPSYSIMDKYTVKMDTNPAYEVTN